MLDKERRKDFGCLCDLHSCRMVSIVTARTMTKQYGRKGVRRVCKFLKSSVLPGPTGMA
jgi:hypothetical protein